MDPDTERLIPELALRHGVGREAVAALAEALARSRGAQAQFNHPDLGGMGQWSPGGMVQIGDMFNNDLKARVDRLCTELAVHMRDRPGPTPPAARQSQDQRTGEGDDDGGGGMAPMRPMKPMRALDPWWPDGLGEPASTGGQDDLAYAYFPGTRRLALREGGRVRLFDTGDHEIGGVSQQQGGTGSLTFTSRQGPVSLRDLREVEGAP